MEKRTKGKASDVYFVHPFAPWLFLPCESCLTFLVEKDQCYRKPSAKAPVIHPGDEAPFLVWGGEWRAPGCLTEAVQTAMIGIDVLL
jgi:hypothetical protein